MLRIFRHYLSTAALCLFLCESSVAILVLYAALNSTVPGALSPDGIQRYLAAVLVPGIVNSIVMYTLGLYDRWLMDDVRRALPRLLAAFCISGPLIVTLLAFGSPATGNGWARALVLLTPAGAVFACVLSARIAYVLVSRVTVAPHRVLVLGTGKLAAEIDYLMSHRHRSEAEVVGYVSLTDEKPGIPLAKVKSVAASSLSDIAKENGAREIVVALDDRRGVPVRPLLDARMNGITITSYLSFWERETRRVNLRALDPSWLIYSDGFRVGTFTNAILKRVLDVVASLLLLLITLPTLILTAIAIHFDSRGPIFYKQERIGRNGAIFTIYKFRTMCVDAENGGVPQWASLGDPRVTRVGAFLRLTRIDELPQILNVLRGDMSFVGPRPERPFFVESLTREISFYPERHRVRPGITGWAQINYPYGASIEDAKAKLSYDLYYIKNYSLFFDLLIILSTAHAVFFKKGGR